MELILFGGGKMLKEKLTKKYAIDRLIIEIGRWCNMTCKHCLKEKERIYHLIQII